MAKRILIMEKREVYRRRMMGESIRSIRKETGISRPTIRALLALGAEKGWLERMEFPTEADIAKALEEESQKKPRTMDAIKDKIGQWVKDSCTYVVMTRMVNRELKTNYSEISIRRYVKATFPKRPRAIYRRDDYIPGEVAEVDFGHFGLMTVKGYEQPRKVYLFSLRLRQSRKAYRAFVLSQDGPTFFRHHVLAMEEFGGVPQKIVCDNTKAAVIKACWHDPLVNRAYLSLAEHNNFLISACPPYCPEMKGGVEKDVDYVRRNFFSEFLQTQKQKGYEYPCYEEACEALEVWEREVDEVHEVRYVGKTPGEMFEEEKKCLKHLPEKRWDPVEWMEATVRDSWRIEVRFGIYSIPYEYIGERVQVCANSRSVVIYRNFQEIARHSRTKGRFYKSIKLEHGPKDPEEYLQRTSVGVRTWAKFRGEYVSKVVESILAQRGVDGLSPARSMISLEKKYGQARLRAACQRAIETMNPSYKSVKNILVMGLDLKKEVNTDGHLKFDPNEKLRFDRSKEFSLIS